MNQIFDVLIVGAGPAGLAAAQTAAENGLTVGIVDDNPTSGGQIWRGGVQHTTHSGARLISQTLLNHPGVRFFQQTKILYPLSAHRVLAQTPDDACVLEFKKLILATGARELLLPFPGWTLPHVTGAGGLQALVKGGYPIQGKRVLVAGTGPLLLAVAATLMQRGATIVAIVEQAPLHRLIYFLLALVLTPGKFFQSLQLLYQLKFIPFRFNSFVSKALGEDMLRSVQIKRPDRQEEIACDYLACGYGLVPNTELAHHLGCVVSDFAVLTDAYQQTSVEHIYCAGESTGIGGVDLSLLEGHIAGDAAAGELTKADHYFSRLQRARLFSVRLKKSFTLRDELRQLCDDTTVVCRCEDVTHGTLRQFPNWKAAKLNSRCGMGPCQSKICGAATQFLYGWQEDSLRVPASPCRIGSMIIDENENQN